MVFIIQYLYQKTYIWAEKTLLFVTNWSQKNIFFDETGGIISDILDINNSKIYWQ